MQTVPQILLSTFYLLDSTDIRMLRKRRWTAPKDLNVIILLQRHPEIVRSLSVRRGSDTRYFKRIIITWKI